MSKQDLRDQKVVIKLIPNPNGTNVPVKYVNSIEYATPKTAADGKTITGVDENSLYINQLPADEQKKERDKVKKLRESLEKSLNLDLSPSSDYWRDFVIFLTDEITLDPTNPMHILNEKFLVANGYVAPSLEEIAHDERFQNCLFYVYREKDEISLKSKNQKLIDKAIAKLSMLDEENPNKLLLVASYIFGFDVNPNLDPEEAYLKLKDYIEPKDKESNQKKNVEHFLDAVSKTPEEIMIKKILDKAIKKRIVIRRSDKYSREDEDYGTYEEALVYLGLPENTAELAYLKKKTGM